MSLEENVDFLSSLEERNVKVSIEVEQRVPANLELSVLECFGSPTNTRIARCKDTYSIVDPDVMIRRRDVLVDGDRVFAVMLKLPLYLSDEWPSEESPPMAEFRLDLNEREYEDLHLKLPSVTTVRGRRRNAYYSIPKTEGLVPIEFSYDSIYSLGEPEGKEFTEVSKDLLINADLPFRRFRTLLSDFRRKGVERDSVLDLFEDSSGYSRELLKDGVLSIRDQIVATTLELATGEVLTESSRYRLARENLEPRTYPEIQVEMANERYQSLS